jgi:GT2 family glycosyltransferase
MGKARVFAVVVTHNGGRWIRQCLDSLRASNYEVCTIVVDNASSDNTTRIVRSYGDIALTEVRRNLGFGRANNIGISEALRRGADHIFLLNQDAYVSEESIRHLVRCVEQDRSLGIVGPIHFDGEGKRLDANFVRYYLLPQATDLVADLLMASVSRYYLLKAEQPQELGLCAAAWLMTRECLLAIGGFDPMFFMYGEDADLCGRASYHGFSIALVPEARIFHWRGGRREGRTGSCYQRIAERASVTRSQLLFKAKRPTRSLLRNTYRAIVEEVFSSVSNGMSSLDWEGCAASLMAAGRICLELPGIQRSRSVCSQRGTHWLDV